MLTLTATPNSATLNADGSFREVSVWGQMYGGEMSGHIAQQQQQQLATAKPPHTEPTRNRCCSVDI